MCGYVSQKIMQTWVYVFLFPDLIPPHPTPPPPRHFARQVLSSFLQLFICRGKWCSYKETTLRMSLPSLHQRNIFSISVRHSAPLRDLHVITYRCVWNCSCMLQISWDCHLFLVADEFGRVDNTFCGNVLWETLFKMPVQSCPKLRQLYCRGGGWGWGHFIFTPM